MTFLSSENVRLSNSMPCPYMNRLLQGCVWIEAIVLALVPCTVTPNNNHCISRSLKCIAILQSVVFEHVNL